MLKCLWVGASRVRDLFKQAKKSLHASFSLMKLMQLEELEGKNPNMGSNDERENTLNQLLTEMDGFGTNSGVIMLTIPIGADVLDRALMREPGRFDRQIYVDMPDLNERKEIFEVHLKPLKLEKKLDKDFLARQTPGFSGADMLTYVMSRLNCRKKEKVSVQKQDFLDAVDRIIGGLEKKIKIITKQEKKTIAYHEAGHATVS